MKAECAILARIHDDLSMRQDRIAYVRLGTNIKRGWSNFYFVKEKYFIFWPQDWGHVPSKKYSKRKLYKTENFVFI